MGAKNKPTYSLKSVQADFFKSMPPVHTGFSVWQDVYKPVFKKVALYVKFQVDKRGEMIISFKAR